MNITWGERLPSLYKSYLEGIVNRYNGAGVVKKLTKFQKGKIKQLKVEYPEMTVIAVLHTWYDMGGLTEPMNIVDFIMLSKYKEPRIGTITSVCFQSYAENLTREGYSELSDIGIEERDGVLKRLY